MSTSTDNVAQLYAKIAPFEGTRLAEHPMERELTLRTIVTSLNGPPGPETTSAPKIADVGGGPGKLAFRLADMGYAVDLVDLTPDLVTMAQKEHDRRLQAKDPNTSTGTLEGTLKSISVGNALDKSHLPADSYEGVLLLGPLYHLLEEGERVTALENALALAKPGTGLVFCAFISIAAHLRDIAVRDPAKLVRAEAFYDKYVSVDACLLSFAHGLTPRSFKTANTTRSSRPLVCRSRATTPMQPTRGRFSASTLPTKRSSSSCARPKAFSAADSMPSSRKPVPMS